MTRPSHSDPEQADEEPKPKVSGTVHLLSENAWATFKPHEDLTTDGLSARQKPSEYECSHEGGCLISIYDKNYQKVLKGLPMCKEPECPATSCVTCEAHGHFVTDGLCPKCDPPTYELHPSLFEKEEELSTLQNLALSFFITVVVVLVGLVLFKVSGGA